MRKVPHQFKNPGRADLLKYKYVTRPINKLKNYLQDKRRREPSSIEFFKSYKKGGLGSIVATRDL